MVVAAHIRTLHHGDVRIDGSDTHDDECDDVRHALRLSY